MAERKIIVSVATSADGFIARRDGSVDWLDRPRPKGDYGMGEFFKSVDTIIMGRKTYDFAAGYEQKGGSGAFGSGMYYVFTHNPPELKSKKESIQFVNEPIKAFASKLRKTKGKDIWMMGGGEIIASFLDEGELDEFIIHVIPVFIGEGIPLIAPQKRTVQLSLIATHAYEDGVVQMHYQVKRRH